MQLDEAEGADIMMVTRPSHPPLTIGVPEKASAVPPALPCTPPRLPFSGPPWLSPLSADAACCAARPRGPAYHNKQAPF